MRRILRALTQQRGRALENLRTPVARECRLIERRVVERGTLVVDTPAATVPTRVPV
ncbi:hypothetical protein B0G69_4795 [Paraburkholderia sp. RAU2J]|nr:hypothetical protein B0G69_4795 [Paraburkholderia sp. RAU2J]